MTLLVGSKFQASIWIRQQRIKFYHGTRLTAVSHKPKSTRCTRLTEVSVQSFKASASKHSTRSTSVLHCIYTTQGHKQQASTRLRCLCSSSTLRACHCLLSPSICQLLVPGYPTQKPRRNLSTIKTERSTSDIHYKSNFNIGHSL